MCWNNKTHYTQQGQPQRKSVHKHKSQVHQISVTPPQDDNSDDEEFLFVVGQVNDKKVPKVTASISGVPISMTIDTGASTNIIDEATFTKIEKQSSIKLQSTSTRIFAYGSSSQLVTLGKFDTSITTGSMSTETTFHVVRGAHGSLLSYTTAHVVDVKINAITAGDELSQKYPTLFDGI